MTVAMKTATFINTFIKVCHETGENKTSKFNIKQCMRTQEFSHKSRNVVSILLGNSFLELKCK